MVSSSDVVKKILLLITYHQCFPDKCTHYLRPMDLSEIVWGQNKKMRLCLIFVSFFRQKKILNIPIMYDKIFSFILL